MRKEKIFIFIVYSLLLVCIFNFAQLCYAMRGGEPNQTTVEEEVKAAKDATGDTKTLHGPNVLNGGRGTTGKIKDLKIVDAGGEIKQITIEEFKAAANAGILSQEIGSFLAGGIRSETINVVLEKAELTKEYATFAGGLSALTEVKPERIFVTNDELLLKNVQERNDVLDAIRQGYTILIATSSLKNADRDDIINAFGTNASIIRDSITVNQVIFSLVAPGSIWEDVVGRAGQATKERTLDKYSPEQQAAFDSGA